MSTAYKRVYSADWTSPVIEPGNRSGWAGFTPIVFEPGNHVELVDGPENHPGFIAHGSPGGDGFAGSWGRGITYVELDYDEADLTIVVPSVNGGKISHLLDHGLLWLKQADVVAEATP